jgi:hypothetical protein
VKRVWALLLLLIALPANAESLQCDAATVDVKYGNKSAWGWDNVTLKITNGKVEVTKKFEYVHFFIACLKNPSAKSYLVYQAYCGGSGCKDLDNWGVVEPSSIEVLLEPTDNNHKKAERIFGGKLKPF